MTPLKRPKVVHRQICLPELLDRVLTEGAVVVGEVIISVAGVELVYLGVNLVLASVETVNAPNLPPTV